INNSPALRRLDETLWGRKKSKRSKTSSLVKKIASLPPNTPKGPRAMMQPPNPVPAPSPRKDNTLQARPGGTSTAPTPPLPKLDTVMSTPTKASDKPPQRQALSGLSPTTQTTQNNGSASSPSQQTSAGARVACKHVPAPATSKEGNEAKILDLHTSRTFNQEEQPSSVTATRSQDGTASSDVAWAEVGF
ncbi:hypothetical protein KEM55_009066, partial [Ascosphaera atra]